MSVTTRAYADRDLARQASMQVDPGIALKRVYRSSANARTFADAVVIPARNEAARLDVALEALARAIRTAATPVIVVVVVNNTSDPSFAVARSAVTRHSLDALVLDLDLPSHGGVGLARRVGCHAATMLFPSVIRLHTTDGDARVEQDWLLCANSALAQADAVCGRVDGLPAEVRALPATLNASHALEQRYLRLMLRSEALLDPDPRNPWPHHGRACGASLSFHRAIYELAGGFAPIRSGEDTDMIARMRTVDGTVRFANDVRVQASCRLDGRAPDGMAEAIRRRLIDPDSVADAQIEPALTHLFRVRLRARVRSALALGEPLMDTLSPLRLEPAARLTVLSARARGFGHLWSTIERLLPDLARRSLHPSDLPVEIDVLERTLAVMTLQEAREPPSRCASCAPVLDWRIEQVPVGAIGKQAL